MTDDGGNVTVWGEVFEYETRAFRDGTRIRHTFSVTDGTSSVTVILWTDTKRDKAKLEAMEAVKKGVCLLISGLYEFDVFAKCQVLAPKSMAIVARYVKQDTAPEKRWSYIYIPKCPLWDAVSDAEALISRAAAWGHKAIAITDHGVVQAFPEAMNAAAKLKKQGKEIKFSTALKPITSTTSFRWWKGRPTRGWTANSSFSISRPPASARKPSGSRKSAPSG